MNVLNKIRQMYCSCWSWRLVDRHVDLNPDTDLYSETEVYRCEDCGRVRTEYRRDITKDKVVFNTASPKDYADVPRYIDLTLPQLIKYWVRALLKGGKHGS